MSPSVMADPDSNNLLASTGLIFKTELTGRGRFHPYNYTSLCFIDLKLINQAPPLGSVV